MNKFALVATFAAALPAYAQFEGTVEMKMNGGDGTHQVSGNTLITMGKPGMRMEMHMDMGQGAGMTMVTLMHFKEPGIVYQINDSAKSYTVLDTKKMGEQNKGRPPANYTVKKLGTDKVAGLKCEHVEVNDDSGKQSFELWTTRDIAGDLWEKMMSQSSRMNNSEGLMTALKKEKVDGFIAKMVAKEKGGAGGMTMELVKVEKKPVPATTFEVPAGYTKNEGAPGFGGGAQVTLPPEVQKQMDEAMKNLTPEQREAYKKAMQQQGK